MTFIADKPYNDLPLLPPRKDTWETLIVYRKLAEARAALAELKGWAPVIPNPKMLINTLALQEAKDSSSIENVFTTADKLHKALSSSMVKTDPQTKEVLRFGFLVNHGIAQRNAASRYLTELEEIGVLQQQKAGAEQLYLNTELFRLLSK